MSPSNRRHLREYLLFRFIAAAVHLTPQPLRHLEARLLARIFRRFSRRHHRLVTRNLEAAFPEWAPARRETLQDGIYRHFSRVFIDLAAMLASSAPEKRLKDLEIRGAGHLEAALERGLGALVFSGHFGHWELLPGGIRRVIGAPVVTVARPLDNPLVDRRIRRFRDRMGSRLIDKRGAMRAMLKALDRRGTVLMLIDQNAVVREGVFVDFFGRPASTITSAAQIHLRRNTPLVPAFLTLQNRKPVLEFRPALEYAPVDDRNTDIAALTQMCTSEIEAAIRRKPEQWFWFHNRWKTRPKGDKHETQRPRRRPVAPHPH